MITLILTIVAVIVFVVLLYAFVWKTSPKYSDIVEKYYNKISKLADNLDNEEEREMYLKIFKCVNSISPEYIEETKVNGNLHSINVDNISFIVNMVGDLNSSSIIKYECAWLSIKSGNKTFEIGLGSSKAIKIRDLLLEFAMWRLEEYYKQLDKDERNKENEAERKMFKEVIKAID